MDVSQLRGGPALVLSGLVLHRIFENNQAEFTRAEAKTIPTIAVVEEAQSVLGSAGNSGEGPYVTWVKEGRKYDLGAVLITQQPGSIPQELLSQGDNWFVFHLLSGGDLQAVKRANAHFSDDLLSSLLNEPIPGQGSFWSSASGRSYPIPVRVLSFEGLYALADPDGSRGAIPLYARSLRERFDQSLAERREVAAQVETPTPEDGGVAPGEPQPAGAGGQGEAEAEDVLETYFRAAIVELKKDDNLLARLKTGAPWMAVQKPLSDRLPGEGDERAQTAYGLVPRAMDLIAGAGQWHTEKRPKKDGSGMTTYIVFGVRQS